MGLDPTPALVLALPHPPPVEDRLCFRCNLTHLSKHCCLQCKIMTATVLTSYLCLHSLCLSMMVCYSTYSMASCSLVVCTISARATH